MPLRARTLLKKLESDHAEGLSRKEMFLATEDLLPVTEDKKTWDSWNFVMFWVADSFNLNTFTIASSMMSSGLNWWQSLVCVIVGYSLVGPLLVLNARPGAMHGIVFPAACRTTFGVFGSLWPVFNRAAMACIWWGVQSWLGGECMYVLVRAIWPSFARIHNSMPESTETTTAYIIAFVLYWILSLPTIWVPIHKLRWLFLGKAIVGPIVGFTLFGWSITRAGGIGPVFSQRATLSGSALGWQMIISISSCFNNMFTLVTNSCDFASRAKKPSAAVWPQIIAMPIGFSITSFLGIVIASASAPQFGEQIWDVVQIMDAMLDDGSSSTRAGLVFIAAGFVYVQLLLNVAANSISAGCDLTALFPRYLSIRRGGYVAAIVGICMNPWLLYKSSATFSNYLGSYGVLLSCIAGPMVTDYWLVRRGHIRVNDLYSGEEDGWYWYSMGVNWRAYLAYFVGFAFNAPGFINALRPDIIVPVGFQRVYYLSWLTGTGISGVVYFLACYFFPPPGMNKSFEEVDESAGELRVDQKLGGKMRGEGEWQEGGVENFEGAEKNKSQDENVTVLEA
ncbi:uracil permease [Cryptococcus wingfieldii CBS 7118]|uniref:Uracil permease n=1 Tax=Cryptococcus wingfieldii CBS 7118 TaxID=1295528 RepID=A0A1E3J0G6_9TREE|nr:uracil permease [Cryptococcus wingfieldii CBS 7118]ODN94324.1 uracil permease [Cryptococcus wingfieldii CBS 7118]